MSEDKARIRILTVDHPLLREGIAAIIESQPDMELVAQAETGTQAIEQYRVHQPDVTLMDLRLPDLSGIDAMTAIRAEFRDARSGRWFGTFSCGTVPRGLPSSTAQLRNQNDNFNASCADRGPPI